MAGTDITGIDFRRRFFLLFYSLFFLLLFMLAANLFPVSTALMAEEPYELTGENITYHYDAGVVRVSGEAIFARGELEVRADRIEFFLAAGDIVAEGEPVELITARERVEGESLIYNYSRREGELLGARSRIDELNVAGDTIRLVSDEEHTIETEGAMLTPCLLPDPHYRVEAEKIRFYPEDRIVIEQVSFLWGETSLLTLPAYVIDLEEDEETGEFRPETPPSLIYELGFDWQDGIFFEVEYPYELGDLTAGNFYFRDAVAALREFSAENQFTPGENILLDTYYQRQRGRSEGELVRKEEYGTNLSYSPEDYYTMEIGYDYEEEAGEKEEEYYLGWLYNFSSELQLRQRLSREQSWSAGEREEDSEKHHPLKTTLEYETEGHQQRLALHYDLNEQVWRREYLWVEELPRQAEFSFHHDYQADSLERQEYVFRQQVDPHQYSVSYRRGYDTEFLPYTQLELDLSRNFELDLGFGRLAEEGREVGQILLQPSWADSWQPISDLELSAELDYHQIHYSSPASPNYFKALETELGLDKTFQLGSELDLALSLERRENFTEGAAYLERDEVDRKLIYGLAGTLDIATSAPESGLELGLESEYSFLEDDWQKLSVNLRRYLDCYSYYAAYDFQRESWRLGLDFDF